jgi:hypothetical protein
MSDVLSTLILKELITLGTSDPVAQKRFADAIARAVQQYLTDSVTTSVIVSVPNLNTPITFKGKIIAP